MPPEPLLERLTRPAALGANLRAAVGDMLSQEFSYSTGHVATLVNGCLFAPSMFTFWLVNGVVDFSTAVAIGAVSSPGGLQVRLVAYLLLVPTFLLARGAVHLAHPAHRRQVLSGSCPRIRYLSLDWFSVGILATGLPLALQDLGPWIATNAVFLVGVFVLPRVLAPRWATPTRVVALASGTALFLYANYGGAVPVLPAPATVVGPVATFALTDRTVEALLRVVNSLLAGPPIVAGIGIVMNHVLTRPELADVPLLEYTLPERDPNRVVATSAALGTVFYLLVVAAYTGTAVVVP